MRTKKLLIGTLGLGLVTLAVAYLKKETPQTEPTKTPLISATLLEGLRSATIKANGKSATVEKDAEGNWVVRDRFGLPVDIENRLLPLLRSLQKAENFGLLTANPKRIEKLDLNSSVNLEGAGGNFAADFGKNTDDGLGAAVRIRGQTSAIRTNFNGYLEADPTSWIDPLLWTVPPEDIRSIELTFPDGKAAFERPAKGKPFAGKDGEAIEGVASALATLRITDAVAKDAPEASAAFAKSRQVRLTLFDGTQLTAIFAQATPTAAGESVRVFLRAAHSDPKQKANALSTKADFIAPPWLADQIKSTLEEFNKSLNPPPAPAAPAGLPPGLSFPPAK